MGGDDDKEKIPQKGKVSTKKRTKFLFLFPAGFLPLSLPVLIHDRDNRSARAISRQSKDTLGSRPRGTNNLGFWWKSYLKVLGGRKAFEYRMMIFVSSIAVLVRSQRDLWSEGRMDSLPHHHGHVSHVHAQWVVGATERGGRELAIEVVLLPLRWQPGSSGGHLPQLVP